MRVQPAHFVLTVAVRRWENGFNGILADEVGLGRTTQPIGMLAHLWAHEARKPHTRIAAMHPRTVHDPPMVPRHNRLAGHPILTHLNWTVLHACAAVTRATMGVSALHPTGCGSASRSSGTTACVPQPRSSSSDYVGTQHNTYATQQHVCNTAQLLQHRSTKCCNTGQLRVAGVWAVPHRRTAYSHARLVQSVQEAHARYAVHDLSRHVRLIAWQRTLLPVTVCSDFAHAVAALQRMAAAAGSKADRAALLARYLKHPGRKTFPVVRVHPFRGASHFSATHSIRV